MLTRASRRHSPPTDIRLRPPPFQWRFRYLLIFSRRATGPLLCTANLDLIAPLPRNMQSSLVKGLFLEYVRAQLVKPTAIPVKPATIQIRVPPGAPGPDSCGDNKGVSTTSIDLHRVRHFHPAIDGGPWSGSPAVFLVCVLPVEHPQGRTRLIMPNSLATLLGANRSAEERRLEVDGSG